MVPREMKDLEDWEEIEIINKKYVKNLFKYRKNYDIVDYNKSYVIDYCKIYNTIWQFIKKGKIKNPKIYSPKFSININFYKLILLLCFLINYHWTFY